MDSKGIIEHRANNSSISPIYLYIEVPMSPVLFEHFFQTSIELIESRPSQVNQWIPVMFKDTSRSIEWSQN